MTDCLVVGQGIAGSCLAHSLIDRGLSVKIIASKELYPASQLAAAVINPVTGRRWVKTWNADKLIPLAKRFFSSKAEVMGAGEDYVHSRRILLTGGDPEIEENFLARTGDPLYSDYVSTPDPKLPLPKTPRPIYGVINGGLQLDMGEFIVDSRIYFKIKGILVQGQLDISKLEQHDGYWKYDGENYRYVLFCDGQHGFRNPMFTWLPFKAVKGELLIVEMLKLHLFDILKGPITVVPLQDPHFYWIGSTYEWDEMDVAPSRAGRNSLEADLERTVGLPYTVMAHRAGIRMAAKDRRPFVGFHPEKPGIGILNGLGTKGASLAPYGAELIAEHIANGADIPDEVNVARYWNG